MVAVVHGHGPELGAALAFEGVVLLLQLLEDALVLRGEALEGILLVHQILRAAHDERVAGLGHRTRDDGDVTLPVVLHKRPLLRGRGLRVRLRRIRRRRRRGCGLRCFLAALRRDNGCGGRARRAAEPQRGSTSALAGLNAGTGDAVVRAGFVTGVAFVERRELRE